MVAVRFDLRMARSGHEFEIGNGVGGLPARVVYRLCYAPGLNDRERRVAMALLTHTSTANPKVWAGQRRIAQLARVNQPDVPALIQNLVDAGVLTVLKQGKGRATSVYAFNDWPQQADEFGDPPADMSLLEDTGKPRSNPPPPDDDDPWTEPPKPADLKPDAAEIGEVLKRGGLTGPNLRKLTADPDMTLPLAKKLVRAAAGGDRPGALAWSMWSGGWRGEAESREYEPEYKDYTEAEILAITAEKNGMTPENYTMFVDEALPLVEAWKADPKGESEDQYRVRVIEPIRQKYREMSHG